MINLEEDLRDVLLEELKEDGVNKKSIEKVERTMNRLIHYIIRVQMENHELRRSSKETARKLLKTMKDEGAWRI